MYIHPQNMPHPQIPLSLPWAPRTVKLWCSWSGMVFSALRSTANVYLKATRHSRIRMQPAAKEERGESVLKAFVDRTPKTFPEKAPGAQTLTPACWSGHRTLPMWNCSRKERRCPPSQIKPLEQPGLGSASPEASGLQGSRVSVGRKSGHCQDRGKGRQSPGLHNVHWSEWELQLTPPTPFSFQTTKPATSWLEAITVLGIH